MKIARRYLCAVIDALEDHDYIKNKKGFYNRENNPYAGSQRSRIRSRKKLRKLFKEHKVDLNIVKYHSSAKLIILKDKNKNLIEYRETKKTLLWKAQLERYNQFLHANKISHLSEPTPQHRLRLYRVFNNKSWYQGGRYYGGCWQDMPSHLRKDFTINGNPIIELDYSALHPHILYHKEGSLLRNDPYTINELSDRKIAKKTLLQLINADSPIQAKRSLQGEVNLGKLCLPSRWDVGSLICAVEQKHQPIKKHFYSGIGIKLQFEDSMITGKILDYFMARNILVLPIHDSYLIEAQHEDILKSVMEESCKARCRFTPKIKKKTSKGD